MAICFKKILLKRKRPQETTFVDYRGGLFLKKETLSLIINVFE